MDVVETKKEVLRRLFVETNKYSSLIQKDALDIRDNSSNDVARILRGLKVVAKNSAFVTPRVKMFEKFLGADLADQTIISKLYPKYKKSTVCVAAEVVVSKDCEKIKTYNFSPSTQEQLSTPKHENVETDIDKSQKSLVMGFVFVNYKDKPFIIGIDFLSGWTSGYLNIYADEKNEEQASELLNLIENHAKKNNFLKNKKITIDGQFLRLDPLGWDDIILPDKLKSEIKASTIDLINKRELYEKNSVPIKRGVLMTGCPGSGKTMLSKILCNETKATFLWITPDDISPDYGAESVARIYDMARELEPTIILFEDIDYIGRNRERGFFNRITGELLNQLDGVASNEGLITLASSNFPATLDIALRDRPGRFDRRIVFELPDKEHRKKMLERFTSKVIVDDGVDLSGLAEQTEGLTGSHMKNLATTSIILAIDSGSLKDNVAVVKMEHFNQSLGVIKEQKKIVEEERKNPPTAATISDKEVGLKKLFGETEF